MYQGNEYLGSFWEHSGVRCFGSIVNSGGTGSGNRGSGGSGPGGGGSAQTTASTTPTVDKDKSKDPICPQGDPIAIGSGAKIETETDFAMPGEMGLKFERYYMSRGVHPGSYDNGGPGWTDNLDFELHSICQGTGDPSCTTATFMRPDGSQIAFQQPAPAASGAFLAGPFTEVGGGGLAKLTYTANGSNPGTYTVIDEDGMVYSWTQDVAYGANSSNKGILASIKNPSGIGWTISHPSSATTVVTHTSGRQMTLTITPGPNGGGISVLTVTDPGGNQYVYQNEPNTTASWNLIPLVLTSASFPGSTPTTVQYKYTAINPGSGYNFPKGLSEVDYNGVAHDLTTYDTNGNALSTSLADGTQKTSLIYGSNSTGAVVTITNPLGHVSVYQYNANGLPVSVTGQASAHCAATLSQMAYDANGNMQSAVDNNGNTTLYTYAATGQLQQKVEAAGTSIARTTSYVWDSTPGTSRLLSIAVAGLSQTSYTYNTQSRLASVSVKNLSSNGVANQTLTTSYGYALYANGMVKTMTVTHPSPGNSDVDTYQYDALGNLTSVTDGLGHATTYSNYNALGEPGHVVGPNGDATDFTYDGRGLLLTVTTHPNGTSAQWVYTYDQFGLVNKATAPDGEVTTWNRSATGMLQTVTHNDKDGTSTETFGYNANGDITSDTVSRGGTVSLAKNVSYDELGRPYLQQGMNGQSLTYTYDGNSNVQSATNAMGHVTSFTYDALNRVSQKTESGGASPAIPNAAPSLSAPASSNTGSYTVSWTGVSGATAYTLQQQINGGAWQTVEYTASTAWGAVGKSNGTYGYRVQACNAGGCGPWSGTVTVAVTVVPQAPSLSAPASNGSGAYTVSWTSMAYATSYTLQEQVNGGGWATVYTGASDSWGTTGRGAGTYGYQVQACNAYGCSGWSSVGTVTVSIPIAIDGQSYTTVTSIPYPYGTLQATAGHVGIRIANGTTWQVYNQGQALRGGTIVSGAIPATAVTVQYTWTFSGVPSGFGDGQGSVGNGASSPTAVSGNPWSQYVTNTMSGASTYVGRTYSVRVDFFNAAGANISSSTCTLTAELEGSP